MRLQTALLIASLLSSVAAAQQPHVPRILAGTWRYPHPAAHGEAIVRAAIEPRISGLPAMIQPTARELLASRTRIATQIRVQLDGPRVRVTYTGEHVVTIDSALGETTTVRGEDGHEARVTQRLTGGWLEQVFRGEHGEVRLLLSADRDGHTLHLDVTIAGDGEPIRWRLDYVPQPATP